MTLQRLLWQSRKHGSNLHPAQKVTSVSFWLFFNSECSILQTLKHGGFYFVELFEAAARNSGLNTTVCCTSMICFGKLKFHESFRRPSSVCPSSSVVGRPSLRAWSVRRRRPSVVVRLYVVGGTPIAVRLKVCPFLFAFLPND